MGDQSLLTLSCNHPSEKDPASFNFADSAVVISAGGMQVHRSPNVIFTGPNSNIASTNCHCHYHPQSLFLLFQQECTFALPLLAFFRIENISY